MSFTRALGKAIKELPKDEELLCKELGITHHELEKLYAGRYLITGKDLDIITKVCEVSPDYLVNLPSDNNIVLDLIDIYIDLKEELNRAV